ncbi:hypothetical protein HHK36_011757 [Tetracentron sinense]|uniref:Nudix hydrolase domain-containing protein n=1 Tax=Tetracentron sinense TaxID=13715 RepID=A0A835DGJ3_TETSI|nr:hypothetical protein HHK36_011757 [Tetracentron sinense]
MCDLVARTGRHQQRYESGCRLIAGCIPFKYRNFDESCGAKSEQIVEVLMINSPSGPGLLFPKGGWENDETVEEAAVREALEEAGVRGDIMEELLGDDSNDNSIPEMVVEKFVRLDAVLVPNKALRNPLQAYACRNTLLKHFLGYYQFKSKTHQDEFSPEGLCKAAMFALLVKEELESWPEQSTRKRSWLTIPDAVENCRHPWMREALEEGFSKWHEDKLMNTGEEDHPISLPFSSPDRH